MKKSDILISVGGPAILGVNSANLEKSIPTGNPLLIVIATLGILISLFCIYLAYKYWYYRGAIDSLTKLEEKLKEKEE